MIGGVSRRLTGSGAAAGSGTRLGGRSLRTNMVWTLGGNVVYAACQWGMLAVLAKLGAVEMVGAFALALATTTPVFIVASLQLRVMQTTDVARSSPFSDYLRLRLVTTGVALLATVALLPVVGDSSTTRVVILLVAVGKAFDAVSDICFGLFQRHERLDLIARSLIANGILSLGLLTAGVVLLDSIVVGVAGWAASSAIVLIARNVPLLDRFDEARGAAVWRRSLSLRGHSPSLRGMAWQAAPVTVAMGIAALNMSIPRWVLDSTGGLRAIGIYAALANLMAIGGTLAQAVGQPLSPRLANLYAQRRLDEFRRLLRVPSGLAIAGGLAAAAVSLIAGDLLLRLLYTSEYAGYTNALAILMLAMGVQACASIVGIGTSATRSFTLQVYTQLVVLVVTVPLTLVLVDRWGIDGAAVIVLVQSALSGVGYWLIIWRKASPARLQPYRWMTDDVGFVARPGMPRMQREDSP